MTKFQLAYNSRTVWTTILLLAVNLVPGLPIDQAIKDLVNTVLGAFIVYFHLTPSQNYQAPQ